MSNYELWYDVETTGLDVNEGAAVVQLGCMLVKDGEILDTLNLKISPKSYNRKVVISKKAMEINGYKEEDFDSFMSVADAVNAITLMVKEHCTAKPTLFGYNNSTFDKYFIEDMFKVSNRQFSAFFHWKQIDVFELVKALTAMGILGKTFNQKLGTIAKSLEVEAEGDLHDAIVDIKLTRGIYLKLQEKLKCK